MDRVWRTITTKTARTSAIFYFSNFGISVLRYFFHLILMRFLAPESYGEFLSYLSLQYLLLIPMSTIGTVVTKAVAQFRGKQDSQAINAFFHQLLRLTIPISLMSSVVLIILSQPLAYLFKANTAAFIVLGISIVFSLLSTVAGSYISAFQQFIFQSIASYLGVALSLGLAVLFINLGFGATGAVIAQLLSTLIITIIQLLKISPFIFPAVSRVKQFTLDLKGLTGFSLFYTIGALSLVSTDILTVRFLLSPIESGLYSALSILGRMIVFGLAPFISLVLPIATHRQAAFGSARSVFYKLGAVMVVFGLIGAGLFSAFPSFFVRNLSGASYLPAAPFLPLFAFSMLFFALSQYIAAYLLAVGRPQATMFLIIASVAQPLAFLLFDTSLSRIVNINFILHSSLLISLIAYYLRVAQRTAK